MFGQGSSLFGSGTVGQMQSNQSLGQPTSQQNTGLSFLNKPVTTTAPMQTNIQSNTGMSSLFNQPNPTQSLFPQQQANILNTQMNPNSNLTNIAQPSASNISTSKVNMDFFHSKLSNQKISKDAQDEMYSKIVKQYSDFSKSNNLKGHMQLESLDLNLDVLDQMILPDYLKFKKSLFQLVALTENNKKDIIKATANLDTAKAQAFLSDQGINISKMDKEINDIKNYLISTYDFSQDLNKINLSSEKNILDDRIKMHLSTTTNALWAKTNDNIIYADNFIKKNKKDLNYFKKMIKLQYNELDSLAIGLGGVSTRDYYSASSNVQSANKFIPGGSTNKLLFGTKNINYPSMGRIIDAETKFQHKASIGTKSDRGSGNVNSANFTPLKHINLNLTSNNNLGLNKYKNINNLSSENYNIGNRVPSNYFVGSNKFGLQQQGENKFSSKQFTTLEYIENLRMINHKNIGMGAADETQLYLFGNYFDNLKSYFYYKLKNEIIIDNQPLLITNSDLENFYSVKDEKKKNNILPMSVCINKLCLLFDQSRDYSRKNIFNLIFSQIKSLNNNWKNSNLTVEDVLSNTIKFYETEFLKKLIAQGDIPSTHKIKSESEIYNMDFDQKFICVEKFATNMIFLNFSNTRQPQIPFPGMSPPGHGNYMNINYSKSDLEKMKKWAIIFIYLRSGLIKDCITYLNNLINLGFEDFYNNTNYGNIYTTNFGAVNTNFANQNINFVDFNNPIKDQDLDIFLSLLKQIYSESKIDENLYCLLSEKIKSKNLKDSEPFKFCCFNLILKINQPVNENIFLGFEDYIWYHLNLIYKKANFIELIRINSIKLNYLSLEQFQDFILQNDYSIFNTKNNPDFILDYATSLFSLLLFDTGIKFIFDSNKNIIDAVNLGFILKELNLLKDFTEDCLHVELTEFKEDQNNNEIVRINMNGFINKITDKRKLFEILLYIKFIFLEDSKEKTLDMFISTISKFGNYGFLLNGAKVFTEVEDVSEILK